MQAYEGYFEDGQFYPAGTTVRLAGRRRAFITILDEPAQEDNTHAEAWREFLSAINNISDEPLSEFARVSFREIDA
jgi:hypothetical protein